jgi:hypothetical protein
MWVPPPDQPTAVAGVSINGLTDPERLDVTGTPH